MPRNLKPCAEDRALDARFMLADLRGALKHAKRAGVAPELLARIRSAIKSAEGANRHARLRIIRAARGQA